MRGYVRDITAEHPEDQGEATVVVVSCQDESLALDRLHQRRLWGGDEPTSDLAIVQQVLGRLRPFPSADDATARGSDAGESNGGSGSARDRRLPGQHGRAAVARASRDQRARAPVRIWHGVLRTAPPRGRASGSYQRLRGPGDELREPDRPRRRPPSRHGRLRPARLRKAAAAYRNPRQHTHARQRRTSRRSDPSPRPAPARACRTSCGS